MTETPGKKSECSDFEDKSNLSYDLLILIVNCGLGSKASKIAKENGAKGTTTFLGHGTESNKLLKFLEISDIRREIVLVLTDSSVKNCLIEIFRDEFHLEKPNHGILFSIPVNGILGASTCSYCNGEVKNTETYTTGGGHMHDAIMVIVEKGSAEDVIDSATSAGARGGTIINARGAGIHETAKLFAMEIEPEKEVVLIISDSDKTEKISHKIKSDLDMDSPGKGIMIILPVNEAIGLH